MAIGIGKQDHRWFQNNCASPTQNEVNEGQQLQVWRSTREGWWYKDNTRLKPPCTPHVARRRTATIKIKNDDDDDGGNTANAMTSNNGVTPEGWAKDKHDEEIPNPVETIAEELRNLHEWSCTTCTTPNCDLLREPTDAIYHRKNGEGNKDHTYKLAT